MEMVASNQHPIPIMPNFFLRFKSLESVSCIKVF